MAKKIVGSELVVKICVILTLLLFSWSAYDHVQASSTASRCEFQTVLVRQGDTVWTIASNFVSPKEDIRTLITIIKNTNALGNNVEIHPGQILKIPVRH